MKTTFTLILGCLFFAIPGRCLAEYLIADVSAAQAKQMGIVIRSETNGTAGIRVWMEFKIEGKLKKFEYAELRMGEGEDCGISVPLRGLQPTPGTMVVQFSADPAYLAQSTLTIYVRDQPLGGSGYRLKVSDFIKAAKSK